MICGVGTDLCAIARFEALWPRFGERLVRRVLTPTERAQKVWTPALLASRWAAKEAVAKALGVGIGGTVGFQDIELTYTPKGALVCHVGPRSDVKVWVSVSHDAGLVQAFCVVEQF